METPTLEDLVGYKLMDLADRYEQLVKDGSQEIANIVESQAMSLATAADEGHPFLSLPNLIA